MCVSSLARIARGQGLTRHSGGVGHRLWRIERRFANSGPNHRYTA
jgi:hypothetical protein